jgi:hypothetical protein
MIEDESLSADVSQSGHLGICCSPNWSSVSRNILSRATSVGSQGLV